jgi:hypothetical protein
MDHALRMAAMTPELCPRGTAPECCWYEITAIARLMIGEQTSSQARESPQAAATRFVPAVEYFSVVRFPPRLCGSKAVPVIKAQRATTGFCPVPPVRRFRRVLLLPTSGYDFDDGAGASRPSPKDGNDASQRALAFFGTKKLGPRRSGL